MGSQAKQKPRRRPRITIALLMLLVALSALVMVTIRPLLQHGVPPCLSVRTHALWLLQSPGSANCNACHFRPTLKFDPTLYQTLADNSKPPSDPRHAFGDKQSCALCHKLNSLP